ncbi:MAG: hypothetical protein QOF60_2847 [Actinomycetota bacterium]|jgi:uncharacterized secreted protein with C-terminal beta-propeller domain|nr:hypothetical protein [Actinomycetota bacterium]
MNTTGGRVRRWAVLVATVALATSACTKGDGSAGPPPTKGSDSIGRIRLISALEQFSACDQLLDYLHTEGAKLVGPYGFGGGIMTVRNAMGVAATGGAAGKAASGTVAGAVEDTAASPSAAPVAGTDYSGTNVQEAGVDEPDIVKTDGRRLVTAVNGKLQVVDVESATPKVLGWLPLAADGSYVEGQLLLSGDKVLVLSQAFDAVNYGGPAMKGGASVGGVMPYPYPGVASPPRTKVTVVDISDPRSPKVTSELKFDGSMVAARMVDGVARVVLRSSAPTLGFTYPSGNQASVDIATESNKKVVAGSTLDDWLPKYSYDEPGNASAHAGGRIADCNDVSRPVKFSGLDTLTVVSVAADDPRPGPGAAVLGAGELVYASPNNLYVTSTAWTPAEPSPTTQPAQPEQPAQPQRSGSTTTEIHKFSIADKVRTKYLASGSIGGHLLNQFSLSEYKDDLRVAATTDGAESTVSVLRQDGDVLTTAGSVGGLGKGERIYAVRFLGDRGYVVTFRQTDPLYVVDLSDGASPKVMGELKIPGYSAYLHPIGDHRLLGVGQAASDAGRVQGTQLSLFDVSDPANPKRLANAALDPSTSEAEYDHHAFLYWPKSGLAVVPIQSYGGGGDGRSVPFMGAVGFSVGDNEVKELGRVSHPDGQPVQRSLVVGDRLLTLSGGGLRTSVLSTLAEKNWLAFS